MNQRTLFQWLGLALFAVGAGALAVTFPPESALGVQMGLLAAAGALFFVAGATHRVRWSLLVGVGDVALGASLLVGGLADGDWEGGELLYTASVVLGGLSLAAIGVLYVLDHDAFETTP